MNVLIRNGGLTISIAVLLLFAKSVLYDFAYDDVLLIQNNPLVTHPGLSFSHLITIISSATPPGDLYRPLTTITYWIDFVTQGLNPVWFHTVNVLLYLVLCLFVFRLYQYFLPSPAVACCAALIFAVHPIHVEAVANIVGRAELFAAIFGVGSFLMFQQRRPLISAVLLLLALISKESACVFFVLTFVGVVMMEEDDVQHSPFIRYGLALQFIALLLGFTLRFLVLKESFFVLPDSAALNPENPLLPLPFFDRIVPALKVLGDYLVHILCPVGLTADYSQLPDVIEAETYSLSGILALALLSVYALAVVTTVSNRIYFLGAWFFLAFLLTSNIIVPIGTIMGDRLALVPSIGVIGFFTFHFATQIKQSGRAIATIIIVLFALQTYRQLPIWENNDTLFRSMVEENPSNPKALYNYGVHLFTREKNYDAAEHYFKETLKLVPDHLYSMKALADIELARGNRVMLEFWYTQILKQYPEEKQVQEQLEKLKQH